MPYAHCAYHQSPSGLQYVVQCASSYLANPFAPVQPCAYVCRLVHCSIFVTCGLGEGWATEEILPTRAIALPALFPLPTMWSLPSDRDGSTWTRRIKPLKAEGWFLATPLDLLLHPSARPHLHEIIFISRNSSPSFSHAMSFIWPGLLANHGSV